PLLTVPCAQQSSSPEHGAAALGSHTAPTPPSHTLPCSCPVTTTESTAASSTSSPRSVATSRSREPSTIGMLQAAYSVGVHMLVGPAESPSCSSCSSTNTW